MANSIDEKMKWKRNTKGFDKNKNNINNKWRPRKLFNHFNDELKAKWIAVLTREQLIEAYGLIFNTDEETLLEMVKDKDIPYVLKLIIKELNNQNTRSKALADYRDYMFWKAVQKVENENKTEINIINKDDEKLLNDVLNTNE